MNETLYAGYTYTTPAKPTQRQRAVKLSLALKDIDIEGHAALKHVITNIMDDQAAVENVLSTALENYVAACNDVDRMADEHRPETAAALTIEEDALSEVFRAMDEELKEVRY